MFRALCLHTQVSYSQRLRVHQYKVRMHRQRDGPQPSQGAQVQVSTKKLEATKKVVRLLLPGEEEGAPGLLPGVEEGAPEGKGNTEGQASKGEDIGSNINVADDEDLVTENDGGGCSVVVGPKIN